MKTKWLFLSILIYLITLFPMSIVVAKDNVIGLSKDEYIEAHKEFLNSNDYKMLAADDGDTNTYRCSQVIYKGYDTLGTKGAEITQNIITLNFFQNPYDVLLTDLFLDPNIFHFQSEQIADQAYSDSIELYNQAEEVLEEYWVSTYGSSLPKQEFSNYIKNGTKVSDDFKSKVNNLFKNNNFATKYQSVFDDFANIGTKASYLSDSAEIFSNIKKEYNYSVAAHSYKESQGVMKQLINDVKHQAELHATNEAKRKGKIYYGYLTHRIKTEYDQLAKALEELEYQNDLDASAAKYARDILVSSSKNIISIFKTTYESSVRKFATGAVQSASATGASAASSAFSSFAAGAAIGYSVGTLFNSIMTPNELLYANIDLIRCTDTLEECAQSTLDNYVEDFNNEPSYENAQKVHYCIGLIKFCETYSCDKYMENIEAAQKSKIEKLLGKFFDRSEKQASAEAELNATRRMKNTILRINCDKLSSRKGSNDSRDVTLILDNSASMEGGPKAQMIKAANQFVDQIASDKVNISLIEYSDSPVLLNDYTNDPDVVKNNIEVINSHTGNMTNMGEVLETAQTIDFTSQGDKQIILLMTDGLPTEGKTGTDLTAISDSIKLDGTSIYTLGFFSGVPSYELLPAQNLLTEIASPSCYFTASDSESLDSCFELIGSVVNKEKYIYLEAACPVNVSVSYNGETLDSSTTDTFAKTSFGMLNYTENEDEPDRTKVLRLKEGPNYDISITGTGDGTMNYKMGIMDEYGDYVDYRTFDDISISPNTKIDTVANTSGRTMLSIDADGNGVYDQKLIAGANESGHEFNNSWVPISIISIIVITVVIEILLTVRIRRKRRVKQ